MRKNHRQVLHRSDERYGATSSCDGAGPDLSSSRGHFGILNGSSPLCMGQPGVVLRCPIAGIEPRDVGAAREGLDEGGENGR